MKDKIYESIENLYKIFSKYPLDLEIEGCPCCVHENHKRLLLSKSLRELEENEIRRYAAKAMTTWGTEENYKHYLPRILELSIQNKIGIGEHITFNKLDMISWFGNEKKQIKQFLLNWWEFHLRESEYIDPCLIIEIINRIDNTEKLIGLWDLSTKDKSLKNFTDFIESGEFFGIKDRSSYYEDLDESSSIILDKWINNGIEYLKKYISSEGLQNSYSKEIKEALNIYDLYNQ
jgi:hypothetical protein